MHIIGLGTLIARIMVVVHAAELAAAFAIGCVLYYALTWVAVQSAAFWDIHKPRARR